MDGAAGPKPGRDAPPPHVIVLGGPNGSGKSTVAPRLLRDTLGVTTFVNADEIARGLSGFAPEAAALQAGRIMLARLAELTRERATLAFESTLAGMGMCRVLERCREAGYELHLVYLWLPSAELALRRAARRVAAGGHDIPESDVRRRWARSLLSSLDQYLPLATDVASPRRKPPAPGTHRGPRCGRGRAGGARPGDVDVGAGPGRYTPGREILRRNHAMIQRTDHPLVADSEPGAQGLGRADVRTLLADDARIDAAVAGAQLDAVRTHRIFSRPVALWRNGQVVEELADLPTDAPAAAGPAPSDLTHS